MFSYSVRAAFFGAFFPDLSLYILAGVSLFILDICKFSAHTLGVGLCVGALVGIGVGNGVGASVGCSVGLAVGGKVGNFVGAGLGL